MTWLLNSIAFVVFCLLFLYFWKEIRYNFKFASYFVLGFLSITIFLPTTFRNPGDATNNIFISKVVSFLCSWMGIVYELRGVEHVSLEVGAMVVANHQYAIDSLGLINQSKYITRFMLIMKRELMYHPAGFLSSMYGIVFLDRHNPNSYHNVNLWAHEAREKKNKVWIHPEGTRNFESLKSQCMLPFKKGAFYAAVAAQIPIIPLVFSPYTFINHDRKICGKGRVIMEALPPIPTTGMTGDDVTALLEKVRSQITIKYRELTEELLSTLPDTHPVHTWIKDVE